MIKYLMETGMKNERLIEGLSSRIGDAIMLAAKNGNLDIVKYLMETGMKNERLIEGLSSRIGDALVWAANEWKIR